MKRLIMPRMLPFNKDFDEYIEEIWDKVIPSFEFDVAGLYARADADTDGQGKYFCYAYISMTRYLDEAIVETENFYFSNYQEWQIAVKACEKRLQEKWREWVNDLWRDDEEVE